jgi:hypothetical protein
VENNATTVIARLCKETFEICGVRKTKSDVLNPRICDAARVGYDENQPDRVTDAVDDTRMGLTAQQLRCQTGFYEIPWTNQRAYEQAASPVRARSESGRATRKTLVRSVGSNLLMVTGWRPIVLRVRSKDLLFREHSANDGLSIAPRHVRSC